VCEKVLLKNTLYFERYKKDKFLIVNSSKVSNHQRLTSGHRCPARPQALVPIGPPACRLQASADADENEMGEDEVAARNGAKRWLVTTAQCPTFREG
jgi:hypothetical protein